MRLTKQERVEAFTKSMRAIAKRDDTEPDHIEADELMADELAKLGYEKGIAIFRKMCKWYS